MVSLRKSRVSLSVSTRSELDGSYFSEVTVFLSKCCCEGHSVRLFLSGLIHDICKSFCTTLSSLCTGRPSVPTVSVYRSAPPEPSNPIGYPLRVGSRPLNHPPIMYKERQKDSRLRFVSFLLYVGLVILRYVACVRVVRFSLPSSITIGSLVFVVVSSGSLRSHCLRPQQHQHCRVDVLLRLSRNYQYVRYTIHLRVSCTSVVIRSSLNFL